MDMMVEKRVAETIEQARPRLLGKVADFRVRAGRDSTADSAVWVTLVLDDRDLARIWKRRDELRHQVADLVRQAAGEEYWPYVSFQASSEQPREAVR